MGLRWCSECWMHHFDHERCLPQFYYQIPDFDDESWTPIRAIDAREAAEKACDKNDSNGDYPIISNGGISEVLIKDEDGKLFRYSIKAEALPSYYATELKEKESDDGDF